MKHVKYYLYSSLTIIILLSCNQRKDANEQETTTPKTAPVNVNEFLITTGKAGDFKIGQSIPTASSAAYAIEKQERTRYTEEGPTSETIFLISKNGEEWLTLQPNTENTSEIGEIMILSDKYKTKEGIGVNSTIKDFINIYPDYKLWYTYVSDRYVIETLQYPAVQFLLDQKDYMPGKPAIKSEITDLQVADFKASASIINVRIY